MLLQTNQLPYISVVIPLYNKEEYIKQALSSVSNQTFPNFEVLIIDDGSTDASKEIALKHIDSRFRIIVQKNQGVSAARNLGIKMANADFVAFLDADDTWESNFLFTITRLIAKFPEAAMFASGYNIIDSSGNIVRTRTLFDKKANTDFLFENYFFEMIKDIPPYNSSCVCVKKKILMMLAFFH